MTPFTHGLALGRLVVRESLRSFTANRGLHTAATLAYFGFLSLMPLLLLTAIVLGLVAASSDHALAALAATVESAFPTFDPSRLQDVASLARQPWGILSLIVLAWSMTPFAEAMRGALREIFKTETHVPFVRAKLRDISAVFWLMLFFLFFTGSRLLLVPLQPLPGWLRVLDWVVPPLATIAAVAVLYRVFSPLKLPKREVLGGALAAAILLTVMRPLFGLVLRFNPGFGNEFGSLKAIFLVLVWVYYLFAVILLGAEIMANLHRRDALLLRKLFAEGNGAGHEPLLRRFVRVLPDGTQVFGEGDTGETMFYVFAGTVELSRSGRTLKMAHPRDYFGEMSLLLAAPRTATAVTRGETHLVVIDRGNFEQILRESPAILLSLLQEMSRRLRETTGQLAAPQTPARRPE